MFDQDTKWPLCFASLKIVRIHLFVYNGEDTYAESFERLGLPPTQMLRLWKGGRVADADSLENY